MKLFICKNYDESKVRQLYKIHFYELGKCISKKQLYLIKIVLQAQIERKYYENNFKKNTHFLYMKIMFVYKEGIL